MGKSSRKNGERGKHGGGPRDFVSQGRVGDKGRDPVYRKVGSNRSKKVVRYEGPFKVFVIKELTISSQYKALRNPENEILFTLNG